MSFICDINLNSQECRTGSSARKVLEAKGIAHYWDMAARCDEIIAASRDIIA